MPFKYFGKINFTPYTKVDKFADYLQKGKLMGTHCKKCGEKYFPPRADCIKCLSDDVKWIEYSGRGTLHSYTKINAAPKGFDDIAPYILGVVDLEEGGRLISWIGDIPDDDIKIGMEIKVVPRIFEEIEEIKLYYTIEKP
ncbi:MAG: Zn-ribbon domain-containing OB-fold protein [Thermoplasmatales archaeon]|nr:MAG: Zn-ribbon domain-containing OB-fold protein [Thermoplasmatales archaeon]